MHPFRISDTPVICDWFARSESTEDERGSTEEPTLDISILVLQEHHLQ